MDLSLERYLNTISRCLDPLPFSERVGIVNTIEARIIELEKTESLNPDEIINKLGEPENLANGYLENWTNKCNMSKGRKLIISFSYFCVYAACIVFMVPLFTLVSIGLIITGITLPILGTTQAVCYLLGLDLPFLLFHFGILMLHPYFSIPVTFLLGAAFLYPGRGLWRIMVGCVNAVNKKKRELL